MGAYYNEIDPKAAAWLRELIKRGLIADGEVDERDIRDVRPADLHGFTQCHFFAGIGVWSYALRRAGWNDDRPVWTGSCPCQPFSSAGKGNGFDDERHLWPAFFWLIEQCRPSVVFGEQVASKDAEPWLDLVQADLEALGYAVGADPFPSAGVGAPHIRDRLYWVADAVPAGWSERWSIPRRGPLARSGGDGELDAALDRWLLSGDTRPFAEWLADANNTGPQGWSLGGNGAAERLAGAGGMAGGMADAAGARHEQAWEHERGSSQLPARPTEHGGVGGLDLAGVSDGSRTAGGYGARDMAASAGPTNGFWRTADWLFSRDGQWRPVEPGTFPLAHGAPARVGRLRGYGNAINAEAARIFIEAYLG